MAVGLNATVCAGSLSPDPDRWGGGRVRVGRRHLRNVLARIAARVGAGLESADSGIRAA